MSKNTQRKQAIYDEGFSDAKRGRPFRYTNHHPYIEQYRKGRYDFKKDGEKTRFQTFIDTMKKQGNVRRFF